MIDCFAYENKNRCSVLTVKKCIGCKFYKTQEKLNKDEEAAQKRLESKTGMKGIAYMTYKD